MLQKKRHNKCAFWSTHTTKLLHNATSLRCLASLLVARSTAFAHPKCRGAWVCFTCSKRSARNSEPSEYTHIGERQLRAREFSAVGTGQSPGTPPSLVVYAHLFMLRITTVLWCFAPKQMAMSKTKVRLKCKRLSGLLFWSEWRDSNLARFGFASP